MAENVTDTLNQNENSDMFEENEPFKLFDKWYEEAQKKEINDAGAMSLATVDEDGMPNVRMVLLKGVDQNGFVFYTNTLSQKGKEIKAHPKAALGFHWKSLRRQIRVRGDLTMVSDAEADVYFSSRPKDSQIGAWASDQSQPLKGRFELEARIAKYAAKYALSKVDRPPHWSGYRLKPLVIEFWRDRMFRLHDRKQFLRESVDQHSWSVGYLYP